jgi:hypothetical protein
LGPNPTPSPTLWTPEPTATPTVVAGPEGGGKGSDEKKPKEIGGKSASLKLSRRSFRLTQVKEETSILRLNRLGVQRVNNDNLEMIVFVEETDSSFTMNLGKRRRRISRRKFIFNHDSETFATGQAKVSIYLFADNEFIGEYDLNLRVRRVRR